MLLQPLITVIQLSCTCFFATTVIVIALFNAWLSCNRNQFYVAIAYRMNQKNQLMRVLKNKKGNGSFIILMMRKRELPIATLFFIL